MKEQTLMTALAMGLAAAVVVAQGSGAGADRLTPEVFKGLELRSVGPGLATGRIADVTIDPKNADAIYASAYQRRRAVGQMIGGGPESGIFKTTNAGKTWTKLTKGLPQGDAGRAGLAVDGRKSPATVFAIIDANRGDAGCYRSDDAGASWTRIGRSGASMAARGGT